MQFTTSIVLASVSLISTVMSAPGLVERQSAPTIPMWVEGFAFMGCYVDDIQRHIGTEAGKVIMANADATVAHCIGLCSDQGKKIASLQHGNQCYCADYIGRSMKVANPNDCGRACKGKATEACGGYWRNQVYAVPGTLITTLRGCPVPVRG